MLADEATLRVQRILRFLKAEHQVKYKSLAKEIDIDVNRFYRVSPKHAVSTYEKLRDYCQVKGIMPDETSYSEASFGLEYILDALDINEDIIASSVRRVSGKYILLSLLPNQNISVTWFQLFDVSKTITLPVFKARRIGRDGYSIIYKGFYYEYMSSLFIMGHIEDTPLTRSLILVPISKSRDRQGVMSGASTVDALFVSPCYLKRMEDKDTWRNYEPVLGEQEVGVVREKFGALVDSLLARSGLCASVLRGGG